MPKNQIGAGDQVLPVILKGGMVLSLRGVPMVKKGQQGFGGGGVHTVKKLMVQGFAGVKAVDASLGLALAVNPEKVAGVVP